MKARTYRGYRQNHQTFVTVDDKPLPPRHDLANHSPDGFEWGYCGSGPSQLALALLADYSMNDQFALTLHQQFKNRVVAHLPGLEWTLTSDDINKALKQIVDSETV